MSVASENDGLQEDVGRTQPSATDALPLIRLQQLTKRFGWIPALQDVSCELPGGQIVAILGANGSGKSTLLKLCAGLLRPSEGNIQVAGWQLPKEAAQVRAHIGYAGHEIFLDEEFTIQENLSFFAHCYGLAGKLRVDHLLGRLGLAKFAELAVRQLSRGRQQLVDIARATLHGPELLLLDEPLNHLDVVAEDVVVQMMRDARDKGSMILWVTHESSRVAAIADRVLLLHAGRLVMDEAGQVAETDWPATLKATLRQEMTNRSA
ncbi:MAG: heme ABC exporter ATP-binding protein CcmA [Anaerolineaceae bacterium]|nr:heme ABC exporter ATP-binding protein CcmA [Anaerolineaceae bacterium]